MSAYHLAQINIATMRAPLDRPIMAGFVALLEEINALAENSPGYVWRLKTESGDATSIKAFEDDQIIVNMTVWESVEALHEFVYYSQHVEPYRKRGEWFERMDSPVLALWWIPAGHIPTIAEAKERLSYLEKNGATPYAFAFKKRFIVEEWLEYDRTVMQSS
jgi:hypothetical protein